MAMAYTLFPLKTICNMFQVCVTQLGHAVGIIHAELLPEEKMRIIRELMKEGSTAMVGDGMNDAPALATADVGISMGIVGSAIATETGHITLMSNDIGRIPQAIRLSRLTRRKIIENIALSVLPKAAMVVLAFSGHPLLWAAILADVGTCLLVIFNSMLILRGTDTEGPTTSRLSQPHEQASDGCCGSPARAERAKAACGYVHCHLTNAHRRNCSHSGVLPDSNCLMVACASDEDNCDHRRSTRGCYSRQGLDTCMKQHAMPIACETNYGYNQSDEARMCESTSSMCCSRVESKMDVGSVHGTCGGENTKGHESQNLVVSSDAHNEIEMEKSECAGWCCKEATIVMN